MNLQWYPGHMAKAKRMMQEDIKLIDVVLELVDARIPLASRNPDIDTLAQGKARIVLLNKSDLADPSCTTQWQAWFQERGIHTALVNAKSGQGVKAVQQVIQQACKEKIERDRRRGIKNRPVRAMVVGIPNVGKSTFINSFAGKACTKTGNRPGVTKGKQWIRLNKSVELLDTPGILWPKFDDPVTGMHLAFIGSVKDELLDAVELSLELITFLSDAYPDVLPKRYDVDMAACREQEKPAVSVLEHIAVKRECMKKGGGPDFGRAAALLLDDFRSGQLGRITLEKEPLCQKQSEK